MTESPLTDAAIQLDDDGVAYVPVEFTRNLERQLSTFNHTPMKTEYMTEKQLSEEQAKLEAIISRGEASVNEANRLADVRRTLSRIHSVKSGRSW